MTVALDAFVGRQREAWLALLQISHAVPTGWCIVGGQMVQLTCLERGFAPNRPTDDGDVALDVRARPTILRDFTEVLTSIGFEVAGTSPEGHQHRWVKSGASIDVLLPRGIGASAAARTGVSGGTTLESPRLRVRRWDGRRPRLTDAGRRSASSGHRPGSQDPQ